MSEFYTLRRSAITDLTALFGFLIGFIGSAPLAYGFLRVGFQTSQIVKGFTWFIAITMGAGVLCAIAGLAVGRGLGWFWESGHRLVRRARGQEFSIEDLAPQPPPLPPVIPRASASEPVTGAPIRYDEGVSSADFSALVARTALPDVDRTRLEQAMRRTINLGAWDGRRLVGILRILTDGDAWWVVTDLLVDPTYRRRGIGRELMARAAARSSGSLSIARIPPGTEGFFHAVNALPTYQGFARGARDRLH